MNDVKEFMKGLPKVSESRVLSTEEQEMVEGGACDEGCKNACKITAKKYKDSGNNNEQSTDKSKNTEKSTELNTGDISVAL